MKFWSMLEKSVINLKELNDQTLIIQDDIEQVK
jgi:hypothetical protein